MYSVVVARLGEPGNLVLTALSGWSGLRVSTSAGDHGDQRTKLDDLLCRFYIVESMDFTLF